jgi:hypothetical protein
VRRPAQAVQQGIEGQAQTRGSAVQKILQPGSVTRLGSAPRHRPERETGRPL